MIVSDTMGKYLILQRSIGYYMKKYSILWASIVKYLRTPELDNKFASLRDLTQVCKFVRSWGQDLAECRIRGLGTEDRIPRSPHTREARKSEHLAQGQPPPPRGLGPLGGV